MSFDTTAAPDSLERLLNIKQIYFEPDVLNFDRGRAILDRHPEADRIEVESHWKIPELHGDSDNVGDWKRISERCLC